MTSADQSDVALESSDFRPVVIAPTYNNASTLTGVLDRIEQIGVPLIVVNDGASDGTSGILERWTSQTRLVPVEVVTHDRNRGKAAAMLTGFAHARHRGFTHAVTMDTDGQLSPEEIPLMLRAARSVPRALVLGKRSEHTPGLPKSNLTGWYTSSLGLWMEAGVLVRDSQCGLRVYPLAVFDTVKCRTGRFGFEAEIIARAVWAGCTVVDVPVTCIYPPQEERVSHFKPFGDGAKGFFMHWALVLRRLIPWGHRQIPTTEKSSDVGGTDSPYEVGAAPRGWSSWCDWLSPRALWRQARASRLEKLFVSAAVGYGAFMACLPLGPALIPMIAHGSKRLHHNLLAVLLGAAIAVGPVGHAVSKASITIGYAMTHLALPDFSKATPGVDSFGTVFAAFPISWLLGGVILGIVLHWVALVLVFLLLGWRSSQQPPRSQPVLS